MKTTLVLAAALALAACATPDKPASPSVATAKAAGGTYFCWRERLVTEGDQLACNWSTNAKDACHSLERITLERKAIAAGPEKATMCDNGQWLVQVTTR